jgi:hypothetical protein
MKKQIAEEKSSSSFKLPPFLDKEDMSNGSITKSVASKKHMSTPGRTVYEQEKKTNLETLAVECVAAFHLRKDVLVLVIVQADTAPLLSVFALCRPVCVCKRR